MSVLHTSPPFPDHRDVGIRDVGVEMKGGRPVRPEGKQEGDKG